MDQEEFGAMIRELGISLSDEEMKEAFKELDVSGDGLIEFEEFCTYIQKLQSMD